MARSDEMRALVHDIKTSHTVRGQDIRRIKADTKELLNRFERDTQRLATELRGFLRDSETLRLKDFGTMHRDIQARVRGIAKETAGLLARFDREMKELAGDLKRFLAQSEDTRMKDFGAMWRDLLGAKAARAKDFAATMNDIRATITQIQRTTKGLLGDYGAERKATAHAWQAVSGRAAEAPVAHAARPTVTRRRKGGPRKKK